MVAWRSTAEFVSKYFTKGRMAVVEGRLQIRDWKDKEGNNRRSAEVVADNVYFGDSRRAAVPVGITAVILRLPPTVLPPEGIPPRWAARPILPRSTRRTATCRSDVPRHMKSL